MALWDRRHRNVSDCMFCSELSCCDLRWTVEKTGIYCKYAHASKFLKSLKIKYIEILNIKYIFNN